MYLQPTHHRASECKPSLLKSLRLRQSLRGIITLRRANQMIKRSRATNTGRKRIEIPKITQSPENRRSRIRHSLAIRVSSLLLNKALSNPRRDKDSRNTSTESVELELVLRAVWRGLGVGEVIWARGQRRRDVVVETTSLVEGQDEEGFVPLGAGAEGIIDVFDELFTVGD